MEIGNKVIGITITEDYFGIWLFPVSIEIFKVGPPVNDIVFMGTFLCFNISIGFGLNFSIFE